MARLHRYKMHMARDFYPIVKNVAFLRVVSGAHSDALKVALLRAVP